MRKKSLWKCRYCLALTGRLWQSGEGRAHDNSRDVYFFSAEQFEYAENNLVSSVDAFHTLRSLLKSEDHSKINFREQHEETYGGRC